MGYYKLLFRSYLHIFKKNSKYSKKEIKEHKNELYDVFNSIQNVYEGCRIQRSRNKSAIAEDFEDLLLELYFELARNNGFLSYHLSTIFNKRIMDRLYSIALSFGDTEKRLLRVLLDMVDYLEDVIEKQELEKSKHHNK